MLGVRWDARFVMWSKLNKYLKETERSNVNETLDVNRADYYSAHFGAEANPLIWYKIIK